ncbi:MAG: TIGR01621 family pseudouridine synthase [Gammaproteobacteria bacterium]|nr:TIGR01621 family pseudouridine synthase [Gammaproteobacteria bacterium]
MVEVVFQHPDFYVVVKPNGISFNDQKALSHSGVEETEQGFFNQCCAYFNEELYPLHRLDKVTSGLMLLGRNKQAAQYFQRAFEQKDVEKIYIALSNNKPKRKQGSVVGDMEKSRAGQWKLMPTKLKPAKTRFFSFSVDDEKLSRLRLYLLKPDTGKTHQLRVALKSLSAAILGDELYNGQTADRVYLHAYALRFQYQEQDFEFYRLPNSGEQFISHQSIISQLVEKPFNHKWPG